MKLLRGTAVLLLRILCVNTGDIVSEEKQDESDRGNDYIQRHAQGSERRFIEDFDDKEWHVSHLKDADLDINSDCKEESFDDIVKKYRKALKEDGSLVQYVGSAALPVKDEDIINSKVEPRCAVNGTVEERIKIKKEKETLANTNDTNIRTTKEVNSATTANVKDNLTERDKVQNGTEEKARRASEYQFSSAEYYDEVDEFRDQTCPDYVDVIHLDIDILRNYDVECEIILEWRSLD